MPSGNFYDENTLLKNIPENIMFNVLKKIKYFIIF